MIINTPLENGWLNQVFRNIIFVEIIYIGWEFWFISYIIGGNQICSHALFNKNFFAVFESFYYHFLATVGEAK